MATLLFRLPDVGEGVAEAEIVAWHVAPGQHVLEDQNLVDVMTDKATVEITSPVAGLVSALQGEVGGTVPVGAVLVEFQVAAGASECDAPVAPAAASPAPLDPAPRSAPVARPRVEDRPASSIATAPLAAPATRRRALERGVALEKVRGTGRGGRILPEDVDAYSANMSATPAAAYAIRTGETETRIIGLRRKIAERMEEAKRRIPHITYVEACDVTELEALRLALNADRRADQPKLSLLPFFIRALVRVLPEFPQANAHYYDDAGVLRAFEAVHVGISANTSAGLKVPVVRHAETRDVWNLAAEIARVGTAARDGSATREELTGSTITLTSLGTLGGIASTPVINRPEVAILAPNKIVDQPTTQGAFLAVRKVMNLSCAFDHRIVDGHDAASFVQRLKRLIEHPALMFLD